MPILYENHTLFQITNLWGFGLYIKIFRGYDFWHFLIALFGSDFQASLSILSKSAPPLP